MHEYFDTGLGKFYFVVHEYCMNTAECLMLASSYVGDLGLSFILVNRRSLVKLAKVKHSTVLLAK